MRIHRARKSESTYDLNLAPFLDIVVTIIPMLLLSVAFLQVRMIETNIPQVVAQKIQEQRENKQPEVTIAIDADLKSGFRFVIHERGKKRELPVPLKAGQLDFDGLTLTAAKVKKQYSQLFSLDFKPSADMNYESIIKVMDAVRRMPASEGKIQIKDNKTGEITATDLMFPDVTFANILEI